MRERVEQCVAKRPGQGAFRAALLDLYGERCAVTGCAERIALEAAHIVPFRGEHTNAPENGLLLRADLHLLFDARLMAVHPDNLRVVLAPVLQQAGSGYGKLHGVPLRPVRRGAKKPSREALRKHFEEAFGAIEDAVAV